MRVWLILAAGWFCLVTASGARAGMPTPLPSGFKASDISEEAGRWIRLEPEALQRLRTISFFVLGFFLSAWGFQKLWNTLQRDFSKLPRLSYRKALGLVFLWGLLFIIVLTMISGARELMTPGAWKKQGFTYKLAAPGETTAAGAEAARRQALEKLRTALWQFAATHQGRFPSRPELLAISSELWEVPGTGARYLYVEGMSASHSSAALVYEPEMDPQKRFVLRVDGAIVIIPTVELQKALPPEEGS